MLTTGCANMIPPTGGPRDSMPPLLVSAVPKDSSINFTGNRITLNFNEFVDIQNAYENVVVSPLPKNVPTITSNFRTVNIKIKDTLEPNTTYSINFGSSLRDINEGNVAKNFTYLFSTGSTIDQDSLSGNVVMAETGKIDTTLIVVLHRNTTDSAVANERPRFLAKLDGRGKFQFKNLPPGNFALYALPNDYSKQYDDSTKPFAFADSVINTVSNGLITLYAYALAKKDSVPKVANKNDEEKKVKEDKTLRLQPGLLGGRQDLLTNLQIGFSKKIKIFDTTKMVLTDTNYRPIAAYKKGIDTLNNRLTISVNWQPNFFYKMIVDSTVAIDSAGVNLSRIDTVTFATKKLEDYGSVKLRFKNIDFSKKPVLQLIQADKIVESVPLNQPDWYRKLFNPGDYEMRILYDQNGNGLWDPGHFFGMHRQPEIVIILNTKLSVRANWDNEKEITL